MSRPKSKVPSPRELMERAVEVMQRSIAESRLDGKIAPKVGAVLLKPDGTVDTAHRCELRDGDHAEYTLLERKNRDKRLDGSTLFSTLEPCAPGARTEPKKSCAERIVWARIKEVWVGIEDPDPTVDRKGIKYLQDNGVIVQMFDRDLQEVIKQENPDFIRQAQERAQAAAKEPEEIKLSSLEDAAPHSSVEGLSRSALEAYRSAAGIKDGVDTPSFNQRLLQQGLLQRDGGRLFPTGFGVMLFGEEPRAVLPQAGMLGTVSYSDGREELHDFDGPAVLIPEEAMEWIRSKIPVPTDRSEARRQDADRDFFTLVREAIVNALVHRDYDIRGAKCQLVVEPDKIVVSSPGLPVEPITLEQMQKLTAPMLSRNPVPHFVFARMGLAEERGLGLTSMRRNAERSSLPLPRYTWNAPYLTVALYRSATRAASDVASRTAGLIDAEEARGLALVTVEASVTTREYADHMGFGYKKAQRHLRRFVDLGLLERIGSGPSTAYRFKIQ